MNSNGSQIKYVVNKCTLLLYYLLVSSHLQVVKKTLEKGYAEGYLEEARVSFYFF